MFEIPLIALSITNGDNEARVFSEAPAVSITRNLGNVWTLVFAELSTSSLSDPGDLCEIVRFLFEFFLFVV